MSSYADFTAKKIVWFYLCMYDKAAGNVVKFEPKAPATRILTEGTRGGLIQHFDEESLSLLNFDSDFFVATDAKLAAEWRLPKLFLAD